MTWVSVCLDTGKLATDACRNDIRGDRTETVRIYPEDIAGSSCTKHVNIEYCTTGDGVANDYCKLFAGVDTNVVVGSKALLKLTQSQLDEIIRAKSYGLDAMFYQDNYVYLITNDGKDGDFKGFNKNLNSNVSAPYKVCTVHTQSAWEAYQAQLQPSDPTQPEPNHPSVGDNTQNNAG